MNPNHLTSLRLVFLVLVLVSDVFGMFYLALLFILLGALTDWLDGFVARKVGGTDFGAFYDQFVDKIFVHVLLIYYLGVGLIPFYLVGLLLFRDFAALGLRDYFRTKKSKTIPAMKLGKVKLCLQIVLLVVLSLQRAMDFDFGWWVIIILGWFTVVWSFVSLGELYFKNKKNLK
jgi:CDP-diacylglycerol---glycerol-3-phosphate 3-phosphatidyltransferase